MTKRDVLDEQMAQRFRWRVVDPADVLEPRDEERREAAPAAPAAATLPPERVSTVERERREGVGRGCADLARQVERVWAMGPATQAAATATLIRRVEGLGLNLVGMQAHPRETVRLWRLVARHAGKLPPGDRRACAHALSFAPPSPREREVVDLLVEIAQGGAGTSSSPSSCAASSRRSAAATRISARGSRRSSTGARPGRRARSPRAGSRSRTSATRSLRCGARSGGRTRASGGSPSRSCSRWRRRRSPGRTSSGCSRTRCATRSRSPGASART